MQTGKVIIPAIVGTTAMTVFSYMVSESKNRNFREPEVLGQLIKRLPQRISTKKAQMAGWGMHYAIGIAFMAIFHALWKHTKVKPSLISGAEMGAASGLIGIIAWKGMFEVHPNPPTKNLGRFFGHLMLAHIVFGIFCALPYKINLSKKLKQSRIQK